MEKENLTVIIVALVAIVGIVALVLNVGGSTPVFSPVESENIAGEAIARLPRPTALPTMPSSVRLHVYGAAPKAVLCTNRQADAFARGPQTLALDTVPDGVSGSVEYYYLDRNYANPDEPMIGIYLGTGIAPSFQINWDASNLAPGEHSLLVKFIGTTGQAQFYNSPVYGPVHSSPEWTPEYRICLQ